MILQCSKKNDDLFGGKVHIFGLRIFENKIQDFRVCEINYIRLPFLNRNTNLPLLSVRNSVCADNFSNKRTKLFSSTNGEALMFLALTVTLYTVLGVKPVIVCL